MTIIKPSPGDLADRLCVLELKLQHALLLGIPHQHFEDERDDVLDALAHLPPAHDSHDVASYTVQLALITQRLWDLTEAQSRAKPDTVVDLKHNSEILLSLREANLERYRLRRLIDEAYNSYRGPEKL